MRKLTILLEFLRSALHFIHVLSSKLHEMEASRAEVIRNGGGKILIGGGASRAEGIRNGGGKILIGGRYVESLQPNFQQHYKLTGATRLQVARLQRLQGYLFRRRGPTAWWPTRGRRILLHMYVHF